MTQQDPLGSASHEARKLFDAMREWLDAHGVPEAPIATGAEECRACPVCLVLSAVKDQHPEVVEQLGRASEALIAAVRALLLDHEHEWVSGQRPDVERIDVD